MVVEHITNPWKNDEDMLTGVGAFGRQGKPVRKFDPWCRQQHVQGAGLVYGIGQVSGGSVTHLYPPQVRHFYQPDDAVLVGLGCDVVRVRRHRSCIAGVCKFLVVRPPL